MIRAGKIHRGLERLFRNRLYLHGLLVVAGCLAGFFAAKPVSTFYLPEVGKKRQYTVPAIGDERRRKEGKAGLRDRPLKPSPMEAADLILSGGLEQMDVDIHSAERLLYDALDQNPEAVSAYLLTALEAGTLPILKEIAPLPKPGASCFSEMLAGYCRAFGAEWAGPCGKIPGSIKQARGCAPRIISSCVERLLRKGDSAVKMAGVLFPTELSKNEKQSMACFKLLEVSLPRTKLLSECLRARPWSEKALLSECKTTTEFLVLGLTLPDKEPILSGMIASNLDLSDIKGVFDVLPPSESLYTQAASISKCQTADMLKSAILVHLANSNIMAASRVLAKDPNPLDEDIACVVRAITFDDEAAKTWIGRIRNPSLQRILTSELKLGAND